MASRALGNVVSVHSAQDARTNPDGTTVGYAYDASGQVSQVTNEEGERVTFTYDPDGRLATRTTQGAGSAPPDVTSYHYHANGRLDERTLPEMQPGRRFAGMTETRHYDAFDRLREVTQATAAGALTTRYAYDEDGLLTRVTDPDQDVETTYDDLGRRTQQTQHRHAGLPDLVTRYTLYDAEGHLRTAQDALGRVSEWQYDALGRLSDYVPPLTSALPAIRDITKVHYEYDPNHQLDYAEVRYREAGGGTASGRTDTQYGNFGELLSVTTTRPTEAAATASFTYDEALNRRSVTSSAGTTSYCFDARNRLQDAYLGAAPDCASPPAGVLRAHYEYTRDGQLSQLSLPDGSEVAYGYEENTNALSDVTHSLTPTTPPAAPPADLAHYHYEHDGNGNVEYMEETLQGAAGPMQPQTTQVTSDAMGRPLQIARDEVTQQHTRSFTYGASYNRQTETVDDAGTTTTRRYFYEGANRIDRVEETGDRVGVIDYTLDAAGNTVARTTTSTLPPAPSTTTHFVYDGQNQLEHVDQDGGPALAEYAYDEAGRRTRQRTSGRDVSYEWDGLSLLEEHDPSSGALVAHYRYADRLLSLTTAGGAPQYYHHDGLRNTVALTTAPTVAGDPPDVLATYRTDLFGTIREQTGTSHNRNVFSGHENDDATGLVYMKSRYYDPALGRFLTQDTYLGQQTDAPSLNRYAYARGNPGAYWDPDGHDPTRNQAPIDSFVWNVTPDDGGPARREQSIRFLTPLEPTLASPSKAPSVSVEAQDGNSDLPTDDRIVNPGGLGPGALTPPGGRREPTRASAPSSSPDAEPILASLSAGQRRRMREAADSLRPPPTFEQFVFQRNPNGDAFDWLGMATWRFGQDVSDIPVALWDASPFAMAGRAAEGVGTVAAGIYTGDTGLVLSGAGQVIWNFPQAPIQAGYKAAAGVVGLGAGVVGGIHDMATAENWVQSATAAGDFTFNAAQVALLAEGARAGLRGGGAARLGGVLGDVLDSALGKYLDYGGRAARRTRFGVARATTSRAAKGAAGLANRTESAAVA